VREVRDTLLGEYDVESDRRSHRCTKADNNAFHAHAWLESNGNVIIGESDVPYVPLATLGKPLAHQNLRPWVTRARRSVQTNENQSGIKDII
jgi:hypothetical protein